MEGGGVETIREHTQKKAAERADYGQYHGAKSFDGTILKIIAAFVILLLLFFSVNLGARYVISRQIKNSAESIADAYVKEIVYKFDTADNYLADLVFVDNDVESANYNYRQNHLWFIQSAQKINDKLNSYRYALGEQFGFLVYYARHDYYNMSERGSLTISEVNNLKESLKKFMEEDREDVRAISGTRWRILRMNAKWYAVNYSYYHEVYACSFVELGNLERAVDRIEFGESSSLAFVSEDGEFYTHKEDLKESGLSGQAKRALADGTLFGYRYFLIGREVPEADLKLLLVVENGEGIIGSMVMQWVLLAIMLVAVIFLIWISRYSKRMLLDPLRYFFDNLERISVEEENAYFENSEILELQQANELYRKILDQAHQLKIEVYEKTEEQQRLQIEYMKLQIQPHFYINCMNMIHNMSCMGDEEGVQMMAAHVSDYFRYIFGSSQEVVALLEELKHIENYLEICKIRYRMKVDYQIDVPDQLEGILIPPLILHTCVENSVKYGCRQGDVSVIGIRIRRHTEADGEYISIEVTDDGPGFEPEVLEQLAKREEIVTTRGTRVGITNVIKRMEHRYGECFRMECSNREGGGARIWFDIPVEMEREE